MNCGTLLFQVKEFGFIDPGVIPPPVIMVQNVSFRYSPDTVCIAYMFFFASVLEGNQRFSSV